MKPCRLAVHCLIFATSPIGLLSAARHGLPSVALCSVARCRLGAARPVLNEGTAQHLQRGGRHWPVPYRNGNCLPLHDKASQLPGARRISDGKSGNNGWVLRGGQTASPWIALFLLSFFTLRLRYEVCRFLENLAHRIQAVNSRGSQESIPTEPRIRRTAARRLR